MERCFKNQAGISLIQVMLAGSMLAGLIVTSMRFFNQQKLMSNTVARDIDLNILRYRIHKLMNDDETCLRSITSNRTSNMNISSLNSSIGTVYDADGNEVMVQGQEVEVSNGAPPKFRLVDVFASNQIALDGNATRWNVNINYVFNRLSEQLGGRDITETVTLNVETKPNGDLMACSLQHLEYENYCQGPGANWDDATKTCEILGMDIFTKCDGPGQAIAGFSIDPINGVFVPDCKWIFNNWNETLNCPTGNVARGYTTGGLPKCTPLELDDFSHLFDVTQKDCNGKNNYRLQISGGKVIIDCQ